MTRNTRTARALAALLLALAASGAIAQASQRSESPRPATVAPPQDDGSMIYLYVSVTDRAHYPVPGLGPDKFVIFEDNVQQQIADFTVDTAPLSLGIVWGPNIPIGDSIPAFLKASAPNTEFFVVNNDTVIAPFSTDIRKAPRTVPQSDLEVFPSGGRDAIHIGLDVLTEASAYVRRVLLVVGRATRANPVAKPAFGNGATYNSLTKTALNNGMQIYTIAVLGTASDVFAGLPQTNLNPSGLRNTPGLGGAFGAPGVPTQNAQSSSIFGFNVDFSGQSFDEATEGMALDTMAQLTGGHSYSIQNTDTGIGNDTNELESVIEEIARGLQLQYRIGYHSTNKAKDGKWRQIGVRVDTPVKAEVWTRSGYYAPKDPKKK